MCIRDRDFAIEFLSDCSILMMHLSRFAEEIILWCSWEFKYVELDDALSLIHIWDDPAHHVRYRHAP